MKPIGLIITTLGWWRYDMIWTMTSGHVNIIRIIDPFFKKIPGGALVTGDIIYSTAMAEVKHMSDFKLTSNITPCPALTS